MRKRLSTSSGSSAADGSSITISRTSCDSARAMDTICCCAADSSPTSRPGSTSGCPSRLSSAAVDALAALPRTTKPAAVGS